MDYYSHIYSLTEDKLIQEIENLNKRLFKINPGSAMYNQLLDMINTAQTAHAEMQYVRRVKDTSDKIIEIGEVTEHIVTPDYSSEELLIAVVEQYTPKGRE
jgi:translation initiation factor 2B subunit (eIF-2B alpha/beta/delta family)